jgi:hypothetical protein
MKVLENYASHEIPAKYEWVIRFVEKASNEGKKVLIWSTFIANLIALKRLLARYDPALIYGSIGPDERKSELKRFRTLRERDRAAMNASMLSDEPLMALPGYKQIPLP